MTRTYFKEFDSKDWWIVTSLTFLTVGMYYSPFCASVGRGLAVVALLLYAFVWRKDVTDFKNKSKYVACISALFVLDLVGCLWSENLGQAWHIVSHEVSFLTMALFIAVASPLKKKVIDWLLCVFLLCAFLGTFVGLYNYISRPYADVRLLVPGARNIAFSIKIAFAAGILFVYARHGRIGRLVALLSIVWLITFLLVAQMLSGLVCVVVILIAVLVYEMVKKRNLVATGILCFIVATIVVSGLWAYNEYCNYFVAKQERICDKEIRTPDGNRYLCEGDSTIENGYYMDNYLCRTEVESAWKERTGKDIKQTCLYWNEPYEYLIYRYLNSKGLHKDRQGVMALTDKDIDNIDHGMANVVYSEKFSLRPRLYKVFFEIERSQNKEKIHDMSIVQRIAMSKSAMRIVEKNLVAGVGTGDAKGLLNDGLHKDYPSIVIDDADPHNQFLYVMVSFGIVGLCLFLVALCYPVFTLRLWKNMYFVVFFFTMVCYMFTESCLRTMSGRVFFVMFFSLIVFNSDRIKREYL